MSGDQLPGGLDRWSLCRQTLVWLRGEKYDIEPEIVEMKSIIDKEEGAGSTGARALVQTATSRTFLLPLAIVCTLFIIQVTVQYSTVQYRVWRGGVQVLSGSDLLDTYIVVIFQDVGVSPQHLALLYQVRGGAGAGDRRPSPLCPSC